MGKAKNPRNCYWKWSAKVAYRTKISSAGRRSVCLFPGTEQKKSTPKREFCTIFVNMRNHVLSR